MARYTGPITKKSRRLGVDLDESGVTRADATAKGGTGTTVGDTGRDSVGAVAGAFVSADTTTVGQVDQPTKCAFDDVT